MLSTGGDLETSVPPIILISFSQFNKAKTGTKHCIMRVQLAAVVAATSEGYKYFG